MLNTYEKLSRRIVKDEPVKQEKYREEMDALNPGFLNTPALALRSIYQLLLTMLRASRENIERSFRLLDQYDENLHKELLAEEENIDRLTDCCSRYTVDLLPHLQLEQHVFILNQYYKVTSEFERLGDHAVGIAEIAAGMAGSELHFSAAAVEEIHVVEDVLREILEHSEVAFRDSSFSNLGVEFRRIAAVCSNVGVATVVRIHPELADHEHLYFESLHNGGDAEFNAAYEAAHERYYRRLETAPTDALPPEPAAT